MDIEAIVKKLTSAVVEYDNQWSMTGDGPDIEDVIRAALTELAAGYEQGLQAASLESEASAIHQIMSTDLAQFTGSIGWGFCEFVPSSSPCECCGEPNRHLYFQGPDDAGRYYCLQCVIKEHEANITDAAVAYVKPTELERVTTKPTDSMLLAGADALKANGAEGAMSELLSDAHVAYTAMLAAAPQKKKEGE